MDIKTLEEMGLSNTEAKIYLALLELGSVTANKIAERSGIHRRTVYDVIETLIEKGLVSFIIEANKKYYQAESPERFLVILEDKKKDFQEILPELLMKRKLSKEPQEATIYRGKKGLWSAYDILFQAKGLLYVLGSSGRFREALGEVLYAQFLKKFEKGTRKTKIIQSIRLKGSSDYPKNVEARYVAESFILPSSTLIWEDKVFIQVFSEKPIGILIRSKEVADSYLKYFKVFWKMAKK